MNTGYINAKGALLLEPIKEHFVEAVLPQCAGPGDHFVQEGTANCTRLVVCAIEVRIITWACGCLFEFRMMGITDLSHNIFYVVYLIHFSWHYAMQVNPHVGWKKEHLLLTAKETRARVREGSVD